MPPRRWRCHRPSPRRVVVAREWHAEPNRCRVHDEPKGHAHEHAKGLEEGLAEWLVDWFAADTIGGSAICPQHGHHRLAAYQREGAEEDRESKEEDLQWTAGTQV